jgi:5-methylcytosine-specific restriction endonuclease McrA
MALIWGFLMYHYEMNELAIKREKTAARELRNSRWWQSKIANRASCHYCAKSLTKDECTMDHVVPIVRGGRSTKGNVVIACKDCNNQKKDKLVMDWATPQ